MNLRNKLFSTLVACAIILSNAASDSAAKNNIYNSPQILNAPSINFTPSSCAFEIPDGVVEGTDIFCLAGVPTEMKDVFTRHIIPFLQDKNPLKLYETKFQILQSVESQLAPYINIVKNEYEDLYIKSHPAYSDKVGIVIHISGVGEENKEEILLAKERLVSLISENLKFVTIQDLEE